MKKVIMVLAILALSTANAEEKKYEISHTVLINTINYLSNKPYKEVWQLIPALQGSKPIIKKEKPKEEKK